MVVESNDNVQQRRPCRSVCVRDSSLKRRLVDVERYNSLVDSQDHQDYTSWFIECHTTDQQLTLGATEPLKLYKTSEEEEEVTPARSAVQQLIQNTGFKSRRPPRIQTGFKLCDGEQDSPALPWGARPSAPRRAPSQRFTFGPSPTSVLEDGHFGQETSVDNFNESSA